MSGETETGVPAPAELEAGADAGAGDAPIDMTLVPVTSRSTGASTPGALFRSCMPFSSFDESNRMMEEYKRLHADAAKEGRALVVAMMVPDDEAERKSGHESLRSEYEAAGFTVLQADIGAYDEGDVALLEPHVATAAAALEAGAPVVAHCGSGLGRGAAFVALVASRVAGISGAEAVALVKKHVPREKTLAKDTTCKFIESYPHPAAAE